jgi:hypothetical protein
MTIVLLTVPVAWAWWTAPCDDLDCAMGRRLGDLNDVRRVVRDLPVQEQLAAAERLASMRPRILAVHQWHASLVDQVGTASERLDVRRAIAEAFPASGLSVYQRWIDAALDACDLDEARAAFTASRAYFDASFQPVNYVPQPWYIADEAFENAIAAASCGGSAPVDR